MYTYSVVCERDDLLLSSSVFFFHSSMLNNNSISNLPEDVFQKNTKLIRM